MSKNVWKGGREGGRAGGEGTEGREREGRSGGHRYRVSGVTAMNSYMYSCKLAIDDSDQRGRVGSGERGEGGPPPCAAPARCCPRAASRPFLSSNRAPTHTYSTLRTHLFTLNSAENRRTRTLPGALRRQLPATPPSPTPGAAPARAPPRSAGPFTRALHNTASARRRRHSPASTARPRCLPTRAQGPYSLSHAIAIYTQTIS